MSTRQQSPKRQFHSKPALFYRYDWRTRTVVDISVFASRGRLVAHIDAMLARPRADMPCADIFAQLAADEGVEQLPLFTVRDLHFFSPSYAPFALALYRLAQTVARQELQRPFLFASWSCLERSSSAQTYHAAQRAARGEVAAKWPRMSDQDQAIWVQLVQQQGGILVSATAFAQLPISGAVVPTR